MDSDSQREPTFVAEKPFVSGESLRQLDWPWLVGEIRKRLRTIPAGQGCSDLLWARNREDAIQTMKDVEEARALLLRGASFPLGNPPDIRPFQPRIQKGAILRLTNASPGLRRLQVPGSTPSAGTFALSVR